jgi:hypothetical protein
MAICQLHGIFIKEGTQCGMCWREGAVIAQQKKKIEIQEQKKKGKSGSTYRDNLKKRLQAEWSRLMIKYLKEQGLYYCWITGKTTSVKGLFSLHVSHYYPKSELWQLWTDPVNSGLSTYNENVNKSHTVTQMREIMGQLWGKEAVSNLDKKAEEARQRIKLGIDPKYPSDMWLLGQIQLLKSVKCVTELNKVV